MHVYVLSDWIRICISHRLEIFFPGREPEIEGRRRHRLSSYITASKRTTVHLVCVIIMYTIYEMYKDVALSCSTPSFSKAEAEFVVAGENEVSQSWLYYH